MKPYSSRFTGGKLARLRETRKALLSLSSEKSECENQPLMIALDSRHGTSKEVPSYNKVSTEKNKSLLIDGLRDWRSRDTFCLKAGAAEKKTRRHL